MPSEPGKDETKSEAERREEMGDRNSFMGFLFGLIKEPKRGTKDPSPDISPDKPQ